jgi:molybdopterin/thiamine biosynthesis adenylyltransferase/rhodanese-related sulfurtransferase
MPDTEFEISPSNALARTFDAIYDIRQNPSDSVMEGAQHIGYTDLVSGESLTGPDQAVLIVCDVGVRSKVAVEDLRSKGFRRVHSLAGGADALRQYAASTGPDALDPGETTRYDRQIRLTEFGIAGQQRLKDAHITVVGAGGLGSPVLTYLVAAGVGTVTVIDPDIVEISNLQRQPLYGTADIGRGKVQAAGERLAALNPHVDIVVVQASVDESTAASLTEGADLVVDATDTFDARYALNRATVNARIPLVYGSVYGFEGQFAAFDSTTGPCYRCVFPEPPAEDVAIDCATIGVLGSTTGVIGSLQASASLQMVAKVDHDLLGHLTLFDSRTGRFDRLNISKRVDCPDCSPR